MKHRYAGQMTETACLCKSTRLYGGTYEKNFEVKVKLALSTPSRHTVVVEL